MIEELADLDLSTATRIIDICIEQQRLDQLLDTAQGDDYWDLQRRIQELDKQLEQEWGDETED
jgi:hypothetical protein